jgi:hypothetical protein
VQTRISRFAFFITVLARLQGQPHAALMPVLHPKSAPPALQFLCEVQAPYGEWEPLAQFIGGLNSDAYSLPPEQKYAWARHAKAVSAGWASAQTRYLAPIGNWRAAALEPAGHSDLVFYPFSGPDAANVFAFFPKARKYVLVGLEPVGCVPAGLGDYNASYFSALRQSLDAILTVNFFRTNDMQVDFDKANLRGVLPVLLFMIARSGFAVTDVTRVVITAEGAVERATPEVRGETAGIAIRFRDERDQLREMHYFSLNLQNYRLQRKPGTLKYLTSLPQADTLIKSASYLLHTPYFSLLRDAILEKSRVIIEDDSGIPFRFFDSTAWTVRLYGTYVEPIDLFSKWRQSDLELAFASRRDVQPLGFAIGYRHIKESNLLVATHREAARARTAE